MIHIPKPEFIKEHRHLIKLLESVHTPATRAEAEKQSKELSTIVGGGDLSKTAYDDVYPSDTLHYMELMTFGDGLTVVGSSSIRSQVYAGDVDGYEVVERHLKTDAQALTSLRKQFQKMIKDIVKEKDIFISDIKSGAIEEWQVLNPEAHIVKGKVKNYDAKASRAKVDELLEKKVISPVEAEKARQLLKDRPSPTDFLKAKDELKFHTIRWSAIEIAHNKKVLRDGRKVTLEDTFSMPALTKLDCIALVQRNRYTDFSVIYEFRNKGRVLNPVPIDFKQGLKDDIEAYKAKGNYFKALKRQFSLARLERDEPKLKRLTEVLNSDFGLLYNLVGDISTLQAVLSKAPIKTVKYEIDQFKGRLANVWSVAGYEKKEPSVIKDIKALLKAPKSKLPSLLEHIGNTLDAVLQKDAKAFI